MSPTDDADLRARTARLALEWSEAHGGPFTGEHPGSFAPLIEAAHVVADEARLALGRWVDAGRRGGLSWAEIGGLLGITRQAAQQRFGSADAPPPPGAISVRTGANAFNELAILEQEGAAGRELIGVGLLRLDFRQSETRWTYRRTVGPRGDDGWTLAATWFPFFYYKRIADG